MFLAFSGIWWRWRMGSERRKAKRFCHTAFCLIATPRQIQRIGDDDVWRRCARQIKITVPRCTIRHDFYIEDWSMIICIFFSYSYILYIIFFDVDERDQNRRVTRILTKSLLRLSRVTSSDPFIICCGWNYTPELHDFFTVHLTALAGSNAVRS